MFPLLPYAFLPGQLLLELRNENGLAGLVTSKLLQLFRRTRAVRSKVAPPGVRFCRFWRRHHSLASTHHDYPERGEGATKGMEKGRRSKVVPGCFVRGKKKRNSSASDNCGMAQRSVQRQAGRKEEQEFVCSCSRLLDIHGGMEAPFFVNANTRPCGTSHGIATQSKTDGYVGWPARKDCSL